jgi:hypothetical protein
MSSKDKIICNNKNTVVLLGAPTYLRIKDIDKLIISLNKYDLLNISPEE